MALFSDYASIERSITDILLQCCSEHPGEVSVVLSYGKIVGSETQDPIYLPIASDCLLLESSEYTFIEAVPDSTPTLLATQLLPIAYRQWEVKVTGNISVIEYHFKDGLTVAVQTISDGIDGELNLNSDSILYVRVARLKESHICRPDSDFHIRLSFTARRHIPKSEVDADEDVSRKEIGRAIYRQLMTWIFVPKQRDGPDWTLTIGTSYELTPPSSIEEVTPEWLLSSTDGLEPVTTLRFSPNPAVISTQYELHVQHKKHGLLRLIRELLEHGKALVNLFDVRIDPRGFYYPDYFGDIAAQSRKHYNLKQAKGLAAAHESKIEALRKLNNEVKRCLIEEYVSNGSSVLELACGHGQDMNKYSSKCLTKYVGIDISREEILEAKKRLSERMFSARCPWNFYVGNLLQEKAYLPIKDDLFDAVSLQLAIHYCVASEKQADELFQRISNHLKPGGIFIGSTGDCDTIAHRIMSGFHPNFIPDNPDAAISYWFGNAVYTVTFEASVMSRIGVSQLLESSTAAGDLLVPNGPVTPLLHTLNTEWGIKYSFWLTEHINADEFVVPWKSFCEVANKYGLKLITSCTFDEFLSQQLTKNSRLQGWYDKHLSKIPFDPLQGEAFSFYKVFAFKKFDSRMPSIIGQSSAIKSFSPLSTSPPQMPFVKSQPFQRATVKPDLIPHPVLSNGLHGIPSIISERTTETNDSDTDSSTDSSDSSSSSSSSVSSDLKPDATLS